MRNYTNVLPEPATKKPVVEPIKVSSLSIGVRSVFIETDRGALFALIPATNYGRRTNAFRQVYQKSKGKAAKKGFGGEVILNDDGTPTIFTIDQHEIISGGSLQLATLDGKYTTMYGVRSIRVYRKSAH